MNRGARGRAELIGGGRGRSRGRDETVGGDATESSSVELSLDAVYRSMLKPDKRRAPFARIFGRARHAYGPRLLLRPVLEASPGTSERLGWIRGAPNSDPQALKSAAVGVQKHY